MEPLPSKPAAGPPATARAPDEDWSLLMAQAQDGDTRAYSALLAGITPYLRALARRILADPADIEEAVQDVLLTVHQIRHTYEPGRPFAPWLATIAQRRFIDRVRTNARLAARKLAAAQEALTGTATAAEEVDPGDYDALMSAIDRLPGAQRQAVLLLKLREMSLKEAAGLTGMTVGALKVAAHRAVKTLRRALQRAGDDSNGAT